MPTEPTNQALSTTAEPPGSTLNAESLNGWEDSLSGLARRVGAEAGETPAQCGVEVLAISPAGEDHRFLRRLFSHSNWVVYTVQSCAEAAAFLQRQSVPLILCDCELPDGTWQDVLEILERSGQPSLLIVSSRTADDFLWAEVLNLGGYDVLMKPFDPSEVVRVVSLAWLHWKNLRDRAMRQSHPERLVAPGA